MHRFRLDDFTVDAAAGELVGPAGREQLDPKVMQVLVLLARQAGDVVSRHELLALAWPGVVVGDDAVSRCIYQLRRHLCRAGGDERHAALVETLPKRGYRLNCEAVADAAPPAPPVQPADARSVRTRWGGRLAAVAAVLLAAAMGAWSLLRIDPFWTNPLDRARFTRVTDVDGVAPAVAISRDGRRLAFLARADGRLDAWVATAGTGEVRNLTRGRVPGIDLPVRSLGVTPDGSRLTVWMRHAQAAGKEDIHTWAVPLDGGPPHPYLDNAAELDWSPDGSRVVYHPAAPGDPLIVAGAGAGAGRAGRRQVYIAAEGVHCHFPLWSPDGRFIYFVQGRPPDAMDIWRVRAGGGDPERITFHESHVSWPVFVDARTLVYLAQAEDGSGPWLYGTDTERRVAHRIGSGMEQYTSLAASADGRRLAATRATRRTGLWRVPLLARTADETDARSIALPAGGGTAPRMVGGDLVVVSPSDGSGIVRLDLAGGQPLRLWSGRRQRVVSAPAVDPGTRRIAFAVRDRTSTSLQVMEADGSGLRTLATQLRLVGAPAWSPDGRAIFVAARQAGLTRLFRVPVDGAPAAPVAADFSRDAAWSPDGGLLVYSGADVGPNFPVRALGADGQPRPIPHLVLPRGARRLVFVPGGDALVVLKGAAHERNFWLFDLATGRERQLTAFRSGFAINDFDVSADGREIVFDQLREASDVVQIDLARR